MKTLPGTWLIHRFSAQSGVVFFASTRPEFPRRTVFGSEAASVPGLLPGTVVGLLSTLPPPHAVLVYAELRKAILAAHSADTLSTTEEGGLQGQNIVLFKKLAARFAALASQEPAPGPASTIASTGSAPASRFFS